MAKTNQFLLMIETDKAAAAHFKQIMLEMPMGPGTDQTRDDPLYHASNTEFQKYWSEQESREFAPAKGLEDWMKIPEEAAEATGASSLASLLTKGVGAEMPMLGALLGSGSVGGMVGGAAGAALGGVPGAILGQTLGKEFSPTEKIGVQSDAGGTAAILGGGAPDMTGMRAEESVKFLRSMSSDIRSLVSDGIKLRETNTRRGNKV